MNTRANQTTYVITNVEQPLDMLDVRGHPRTPNTCFWFSNIRNLVRARFLNFLECCIQMVVLSLFYHNTIIHMSEQQQSFFALRSPAAVWRARGLQQKNMFAEPCGLVIQSCSCTNSSCTVQPSAYKVVKHFQMFERYTPAIDGLLLNFGQKCVHDVPCPRGKSENSKKKL